MKNPNVHTVCLQPVKMNKQSVHEDEKQTDSYYIYCCGDATKKHPTKEACLAEWHETNHYSLEEAEFLDRNIIVRSRPVTTRCSDSDCGAEIEHQYKRIITIACLSCDGAEERIDLLDDDLTGTGELMLKFMLKHKDGCLIDKAVPQLRGDKINE